MSDENRLRLQRAMDQNDAIHARANSPYERVAGVESMCPVCRVIILPGDKIASPANVVMSWRHLGCAICRQCGAWLNAEGTCGASCGAVQAESAEPLGSWWDASVTFTAPSRAFYQFCHECTTPVGQQKLPWCRVISIKELIKPPRATTLAMLQAHLQFFVEDAPQPGRETLVREAAKNLGVILGNEYDHWEVKKVACDLGDVGISNEVMLDRAPAWASGST